jgi:hypothetical protein
MGHDYGLRRFRWYIRPKGSEIVCAHAVRRVRAHSRPPLWTADIVPGLLDVRVYRVQGWNARDSVELAADAATPYVAVVIGQKFSADANQEQEAMTQTRKVTPKQPVGFVFFAVLNDLLANFQSNNPRSEILTGTAGDGKTYHSRETWLRLGGDEGEWNTGRKVQKLPLGSCELVVVKDLSELRAEESAELLQKMAIDVAIPVPERVYLIAANHGQLLEKLKAAPPSAELKAMIGAVEEMLVTGTNPNPAIHLNLKDLSQAPASSMLEPIVGQPFAVENQPSS